MHGWSGVFGSVRVFVWLSYDGWNLRLVRDYYWILDVLWVYGKVEGVLPFEEIDSVVFRIFKLQSSFFVTYSLVSRVQVV